MTDTQSDRPEPRRPSNHPIVEAPSTIPALRGALAIHAILTPVFGIPTWLMALGLAVMGADSDDDLIGVSVFFLVILGPTPLLNILAALHLANRPRRAKVYLVLALVFAWLQVAVSLLLTGAFAAGGNFIPLLLAILFALLVGSASKEAV